MALIVLINQSHHYVNFFMKTDADFLTEALPEMQDYLFSKELFWPLSASLPRLTIGGTLLALARLSVVEPALAQKRRQELESVRGRWRTMWEQKAARETANRLRLWNQFLAETRSSPGKESGFYPQEVRNRAMLDFLLEEVPNAPERSALMDLDTVLKGRLHPGMFVWPGLEQGFPAERFWYLYGSL